MTSKLIDVWDIETFDDALVAELEATKELLCNYEKTETINNREQQASKDWILHKENPYTAERQAILEEGIMPMMGQRIIRAWHHTRLTDDETDLFRANGIYTSDIKTIPKRLGHTSCGRNYIVQGCGCLEWLKPLFQSKASAFRQVLDVVSSL
jgi:hypothetical protein